MYPCDIPHFNTLPLVTNNYKIIYLCQVNKKIKNRKMKCSSHLYLLECSLSLPLVFFSSVTTTYFVSTNMVDPTHLKASSCSLIVVVDNSISLSPPNHRLSIYVVELSLLLIVLKMSFILLLVLQSYMVMVCI